MNDESNLNVYDANFAEQRVEVFDDDEKQLSVITREKFHNRSIVDKVLDPLAGVPHRQL